MHIGIPRERMQLEARIALTPAAVADLVRHGHRVFVERGAGSLSGYADTAYLDAGAELVADTQVLFAASQMVVKVKEPQPEELEWLRPDHLLFGYLHLAAHPGLLRKMVEIGLTAVGFETVEEHGGLPLLAPMSTIAGRLAVQIGAHLLHAPQGGKGILLGGLAGAPRGKVVVFGAGSAGGHAARSAAALGAEVTVFDTRADRREAMHELGPNVTALYPDSDTVAEAIARVDLLIGAVLVTGRRAPRVVSAAGVAGMQPGSVIVDISVDQGGCIETTRPTNYAEPTYRVHEVTHFAVTNMPGAVARTATQALSASILPYVLRLAADDGLDDPVLSGAVNVRDGRVVHPALEGVLAG